MRRALLYLTPLLLTAIPYEVEFVGLSDRRILNSIRDASDLVMLQNRPPASLNGIRYRAAGDVPDLLKVLHAYGYYDAEVHYTVKLKEGGIAQVTVQIDPSEQYKVGSYEVFHGDCTEIANVPCCFPFSAESLGIPIGSPALSVSIVNAELNLLTKLSQCGYPLASIEKRRVIVDMELKSVEAASCIDEGPLSKFGPLSIFGLKSVQPRFIMRRIAWKEGEIYNSLCTEEAQRRLLDSDLFSSVLISHDRKLDEQGELPIKMSLTEAKHKQISLGVFYATVDGPGGVFSWTHRNLRGMGEGFSIHAEFSKRYLSGLATYKKPDFLTLDQTYRLVGQIERQNIRPFIAFIYRGANYLDRKLDRKKNFSIGLEVQHINVSDSANNGTYLLCDIPVLFRYNNADDVMNPTKGYTIVYQPHFFQSLDHSTSFIKQRLTTTFYIPLKQKWLTFAGRIQFGSIAGARQKDVPLPLLFLGGSEDDLRGYRYMTVSPINEKRQPLGGRSAIFLTSEMRFRFGDLGIVPFADFGTVTFNELPTVEAKWFKSLGIGLRYFTFFGPLRADVGFPLDRRKGIDPAFRIYASIGQAF